MSRRQKREALECLMSWSVSKIRLSLANPTVGMPPTMLALHLVALRRKGVEL